MVNSKARNNKQTSFLYRHSMFVCLLEKLSRSRVRCIRWGLVSMSNYIIWHTAGSNILNYSDKLANTSSGWDAVQCVGRQEKEKKKHYFPPFKNTKRCLKMEAAGRLHHRRPPDRLHKDRFSKAGTVRNTM